MVKGDYLIATVKDGFLRTDDGRSIVTLNRNLYDDVTSKLKEGDVVKIENYWDRWTINATNEEILKGRCITFTVEDNEALKGDKTSPLKGNETLPLETDETETTLNYTNNEEGVVIADDGDSKSN